MADVLGIGGYVGWSILDDAAEVLDLIQRRLFTAVAGALEEAFEGESHESRFRRHFARGLNFQPIVQFIRYLASNRDHPAMVIPDRKWVNVRRQRDAGEP